MEWLAHTTGVANVTVAALPLCPARSVAGPVPHAPQSTWTLAVVGVAAEAVGARTSAPATMAAVPIAKVLIFM
ncbi:hypothetical protein GCM10010243_65320 [Streptomyces matensis]|nr:hypothetical protein GCM10010243_65320 [Streptomyces matensis]